MKIRLEIEKRIVITGLGTINAIANNVPDFQRH